MNKVEKLLTQLCPDGVPRFRVIEVCVRHSGLPLTAGQMKVLNTDRGDVRIFAGGQTIADVNSADINGQFIEGPGLIVKSRGIIDFEFWRGRYSHKNELWSYKPRADNLELKFLYYFLKTKVLEVQSIAKANSVKMPQIKVGDIDDMLIPLPPLEVQQEIVGILDTFTDLEAELEAELEARKTQANFYKRFFLNLATFPTAHLGDVVEVLDNLRKPVSRDKRETGEYPYYGANGIQGYVKNYIFDGTYLLMGEDGSVINPDHSPVLTWVEGKVWVNNHAHVLREKSERASLRYIYYALQTRNVSQIVRGTPPKINQANMRGIEIPLPPLKEQIAIAKALDHFTKLEIQIATELDLRRKQYEYYRYKLLTFKEFEAA
jgi:type I restriction enzyme S subunit